MPKSQTPWKKSRTLGDIYGGRTRRKFADNIFRRAHSITKPSANDVLPILIEDNPSRDFFFPLDGEEVVEALKALPKRDHAGITHVWLRRLKKQDYLDGSPPYATFTCGSGVRLITLYPFPNDLTYTFGRKRPPNTTFNDARRFGAQISQVGKDWQAKWGHHSLRRFYTHILYHEVGHHIDWYRRLWSQANSKELEEAAEQYAFAKTATARHVINRLDNIRSLEAPSKRG
ncbi:hypothetical protein [Parasphingorhabdus sp.]|uniref:hypothetical protein n=1 Tax=Parasphingorhabdus sp. TaxID=2709688 RepID=UPI002B269202|nr:hypothetical protein [Parasphingorhabdus sp.]